MTSIGPENPEEVEFNDDPSIPLPPPPTIGAKLAEKRETVRGRLAGGLAILLGLLDGAVLLLAFTKVRPFDHDLIDLLLAGIVNPIVVLVGAVLGFYFGDKSGNPAP